MLQISCIIVNCLLVSLFAFVEKARLHRLDAHRSKPHQELMSEVFIVVALLLQVIAIKYIALTMQLSDQIN